MGEEEGGEVLACQSLTQKSGDVDGGDALGVGAVPPQPLYLRDYMSPQPIHPKEGGEGVDVA